MKSKSQECGDGDQTGPSWSTEQLIPYSFSFSDIVPPGLLCPTAVGWSVHPPSPTNSYALPQAVTSFGDRAPKQIIKLKWGCRMHPSPTVTSVFKKKFDHPKRQQRWGPVRTHLKGGHPRASQGNRSREEPTLPCTHVDFGLPASGTGRK
jgi:hypothetical protein